MYDLCYKSIVSYIFLEIMFVFYISLNIDKNLPFIHH